MVNGDLDVASHWFDDKCEKCYYSTKSYPSDLSFRINDAQDSIVDHLDIKGVITDNSLNFSKHIAKITKKVRKQLDVLSKLKNMLSTSKMCL